MTEIYPHKIESKDVNLYYENFHALKGISMSVEKNTVCALIGPSGCGKSTFLRLFNRMNDLIDGVKIEGKCLIDGKNIYSKEVKIDELRKRVGMVFQKPNPFPKSIFENVAYGLRVNGISHKTLIEERVERSLKQAALWEEPASALDPISTSKIEELIYELKSQYTIIIVTHNMQQAGRVSDSTAFFYMGELIEYDLTKKLFTNPSDTRTQDYITGRFG